MQIQSKKPYNEINITPLVDLTFVLLIIFILLTTAAVQGIKVDLPSASSAVVLDQPKSRVIAVTNDGTISIDAVPVSLAELRSEEHTSELQSLMRTSYAVFCLNKQNTTS